MAGRERDRDGVRERVDKRKREEEREAAVKGGGREKGKVLITTPFYR